MRKALLLALAVLAAWSTSAWAQDCPKTTVADLEDEVMCPVCGTSLGLAREAPLAQRERALITRLAAQCQSKEQIKARLVAEFGPGVLALPPDKGFDAAVYAVPVVGGAVALSIAALVLGRWRRRETEDAAPRSTVTDADRLLLDAELDQLR